MVDIAIIKEEHMKAIIVAAGKGSRISDEIGSIPKSLLRVNGKTIIENTVDKLLDRGISVSICVGYKYDMIENELKDKCVNFYYNPFYEITNNIASVWFAKDEFDKNDDVIILSADVIFDEQILDKLCTSESELTMATDKSRIYDGDYFFTLNNNGQIVEFGPDIPENKRNCEYIGLTKVKKEMCKKFKNRLEDMVWNGNIQCYFENVFLSFIEDDNVNLKTVDVSGLFWREIDFYKDYKKALQQI